MFCTLKLLLIYAFFGSLYPAIAKQGEPKGYLTLVKQYEKLSPYKEWNKKSQFIKQTKIAATFWRNNPTLKDTILTKGLVVGAVKLNESKQNSVKTLIMQSIGVVNVPLKQSFEFASNLENYTRMSKYIEKIQVYKTKKLLYARTRAFNYYAEFLVQTMQIKPNNEGAQLQWRVVGGLFEGMVIVFNLRPLNEHKTEVVMTAKYKFKTLPLPLPKFFVEFGLEVIMQETGKELSKLLEADYAQQKESLKNGKPKTRKPKKI